LIWFKEIKEIYHPKKLVSVKMAIRYVKIAKHTQLISGNEGGVLLNQTN